MRARVSGATSTRLVAVPECRRACTRTIIKRTRAHNFDRVSCALCCGCGSPACTAAAVFEWICVFDQQFKQQILKFRAPHGCTLLLLCDIDTVWQCWIVHKHLILAQTKLCAGFV